MKKTSFLVLLAIAFSSQVQAATLLDGLSITTPENQAAAAAQLQVLLAAAIGNVNLQPAQQAEERRQKESLALLAQKIEKRANNNALRRQQNNIDSKHTQYKKPHSKHNKQVRKDTPANRLHR